MPYAEYKGYMKQYYTKYLAESEKASISTLFLCIRDAEKCLPLHKFVTMKIT